jgi:hypothetical protein
MVLFCYSVALTAVTKEETLVFCLHAVQKNPRYDNLFFAFAVCSKIAYLAL